MNEYFAQTLTNVLEETSTNMGNAMVLDHLAKQGTVTLEEAEFYHNLCTDVITESAEDFIPETLEVPEAQVEVAPEAPAGEGEIFYDKAGNAFMFSGGQMMPVDEAEMGDAGIEGEDEPEGIPEPQPEGVPEEGQVPAQFAEGTAPVEGETPAVVEEGTVVAPEVEGETPAVVEEGTVVAPAVEGETPAVVEGETPAVVEEGTVVAPSVEGETPVLLEESDNVVARILANLK